MSEIVTGTVKWFNSEKGYGFITAADQRDVFVHMRALAEGRSQLSVGELVYFQLRQSARGIEAIDVHVGEPPPPPKPALPSVDLPLPAEPGYASMRIVVRPSAPHMLARPGHGTQVVAFAVALEANAAELPKALPQASQPTTCLVLISIKHWQHVCEALAADAQDALVVDGYVNVDSLAPGVLTLRATSVTTTALLNAKRAAQALRDSQSIQAEAT